MSIAASPKIQKYFDTLKKDCFAAYDLAQHARKKGYDPDTKVEVALAETLAERVIGLTSILAPQLVGCGAEKRIEELEKEYGILDWRVGMVIAHEIATGKFCRFESKLEAIEVGVRVGFAYVTLGVVSSPIEGFTGIEIRKRRDGRGEFFRLNYAGPIRNAGGTAAAVSVLIADYVRKKMGYDVYDPDEKEIERCPAELEDYHAYVANLQYFPSPEETRFMMKNIPVEIAGDASEKRELSNVNLKDLERIETNNLRSGYCLIHSSCIPLKGPKLWKRLSEWGKDMDMEQWNFLEEYIVLQKKMKAAGTKETKEKISPDFTYITDIVAGRPVLGHPLRTGGLRLRYGRSRASGYSGQSIHPATMLILDDFIATGTQLKVERPGKAASFTPCDTIEGPVVKLNTEEVVQLNTSEDAKKYRTKIQEILFLGDVLINYGDFFDRAHTLVPPGYCEEFWALEVQEYFEKNNLQPSQEIQELLDEPHRKKPSFTLAKKIAHETQTPLHPKHTFFWLALSTQEHCELIEYLAKATIHEDRVVFPISEQKALLETIGIPHKKSTENIVVENDCARALVHLYGFEGKPFAKEHAQKIQEVFVQNKERPLLETLNLVATTKLRDKSGIFIGARMGRPEKAKLRKMTGSPHTLFPVGEEGGRLRSFQAALEKGYIKTAFPINKCEHCDTQTPLFMCETCDRPTKKRLFCTQCGDVDECPHDPQAYKEWEVPIKRIFEGATKKLGMQTYPDLIKGVRGTANRSHIPEHIAKGILRARHEIHVNKDGTIRYDASEVTLTHFKPREIAVPFTKLVELGYTHDVHGKPLENDEQILEIFPQDVVLPCCKEKGYPDEPADKVLFQAANFIDELLVKFYNLPPYYNLNSPKDLVGQYIIGLAPHTSAGMLGRIIGFSKTQSFFAHPLMHAAMRRDCDGDESCFLLLMDTFLNFSKKYLPESRGGTMDAPIVLTYWLNPSEVDDMAFNVDTVWKYPLEFYHAALEYKKPWDVPISRAEDFLGTPQQFEGMGFTHDTFDLNAGVLCSAYKSLPSMGEKLEGQLKLARKIRAVDQSDVAQLIINKHFIRDLKGNLRKFSQQQFRCVNCNEKYRRPPLCGNCKVCKGKIIFTISPGSVTKYLEMSLRIAQEYGVSDYLKQDLELLQLRIEGNFGRAAEKQEGLGKFLG